MKSFSPPILFILVATVALLFISKDRPPLLATPAYPVVHVIETVAVAAPPGDSMAETLLTEGIFPEDSILSQTETPEATWSLGQAIEITPPGSEDPGTLANAAIPAAPEEVLSTADSPENSPAGDVQKK